MRAKGGMARVVLRASCQSSSGDFVFRRDQGLQFHESMVHTARILIFSTYKPPTTRPLPMGACNRSGRSTSALMQVITCRSKGPGRQVTLGRAWTLVLLQQHSVVRLLFMDHFHIARCGPEMTKQLVTGMAGDPNYGTSKQRGEKDEGDVIQGKGLLATSLFCKARSLWGRLVRQSPEGGGLSVESSRVSEVMDDNSASASASSSCSVAVATHMEASAAR
ncbi:hypothetical protein EYF80_014441 [Liparis tanakae]|uniref:Uncharacterized protein n=1 Tax=Liparis tanakae TaxID=230148 RepID=A0A4Z2IDD1_9TELE|nr:hypothetical protein EYF80_014441 [Liparis tanakae]